MGSRIGSSIGRIVVSNLRSSIGSNVVSSIGDVQSVV